ncbi:hypothetical protein NA57DRAFT_37906 [Rhizodiscina lignyota]|uniref:Dopey N-terminal domain-containing protein n=1 Tax=Rhizodiscina lignyota TaxID=1504668 RepID=A0A9P4IDZ9_9PEZI|nr:hypothetical protein NA57DRAFT_37906 [Rhizodiscina lignyota]
MALDPTGNKRAISPVSSGRSSPVPRALPRRNLEDGPKSDKNYRKYASGVERALAQFDTTQQEWADYISFLGRLLKALQGHPPEARTIPHSATVATRLAQCLNPGLPSGVHQKAIEVYAHIFATLGKDALAVDLQLYFSGLSSVLSFASLSVRPAFLSLVESYFLPLDPQAIRPALKAIILALLPGLEDDTSEDFDRILHLLNRFRKSTIGIHAGDQEKTLAENDSYFWQCLFLATITNPSRRQGALAFLSRSMPKLSSAPSSTKPEDGNPVTGLASEAQALVTPEPGLLVRCFAAGLADSQLLIQRGFLDLLVTHVPLGSPVLQNVVQTADLERLVIAAARVVNRRDMSLNRRLWAWFLGPEPKSSADDTGEVKSPTVDLSSHHAAYFSQYGSRPLATSILRMIKAGGTSPSDRARPFRICLSLMDRWEVGGLLVPEIFIPALDSVYRYSLQASRDQTEEVVRSASIFFDGVESGLIWSQLLELATTAFGSKTLTQEQRLQKLRLYHFIVSRFNVREEEMLMYHIPLSLLGLLALTCKKRRQQSRPDIDDSQLLSLAFQICEVLISLVPERALFGTEATNGSVNGQQQLILNESKVVEIADRVEVFYEYKQGSADVEHMPFNSRTIGQLILRVAAVEYLSSLDSLDQLDASTRLFMQVTHKVPVFRQTLEELSLLTSIVEHLQSGKVASFVVVSSVTTITAALHYSSSNTTGGNITDISSLAMTLVQSLWPYLSPTNPKYHVEAVRCLWTVQAISFPERYVESALTSLLEKSSGADAGRRFSTLWNHTIQERNGPNDRARGTIVRRVSGMPGMPVGSTTVVDHEAMLAQPLLSLLDSLADGDSELFVFIVSWLQELPSLGRVFSILTTRLCCMQCIQRAPILRLGTDFHSSLSLPQDDSRECLYYMQHIANILKYSSDHTWMTIAGDTATGFEKDSEGKPQQMILQNLLVEICMRVLDIPFFDSSRAAVVALHRVALSILQSVLRSPFAAPLKELELEVSLLERLQRSLDGMDSLLQSSLLETILAALKLQMSTNTTAQPVLPDSPSHLRKFSRDGRLGMPRLSVTSENNARAVGHKPPPQLVSCLKAGFSAKSSQLVLDSWVEFFVQVLPLFADSIFQSLIPLVENFCAQIANHFDLLKTTFENPTTQDSAPEPSLISLMNGLEHILAQGHERLVQEEAQSAQAKSPEQPQGFFGNMVSGVFAPEQQQVSRSTNANNRLTVLLCFQDTVRISFTLWSWGVQGTQDPTSVASFGYTSLRIRNRARRLLEHLFAAEALECLETMCVLWCRPPRSPFDTRSIISLLNVLNGSKPKNTIPAIFNALYSRTNPSALEPQRMSSLTSDLSDTEIMLFLLEYMRSLEDDTMDEIWVDCITFLKDVLANPMPHRQVLPALLEFTAILAEKVENTNYGVERKMRRELGDLFVRLLTATFTTRSMTFTQDSSQGPVAKSTPVSGGTSAQQLVRLTDVVALLSTIAPKMILVLGDSDRIAVAANSISTSVLGPALHSKSFPENMSSHMLSLFQQICLIPQAAKSWRKDASEAFNDSRFFSSQREHAKAYWLPILFQLNVSDKERMPELLSRLTAPTTAGIMFGVGATSARQEADRKTQLNLRRIATLALACPEDTFVSTIATIAEKVSELLTATAITSPSSATRAELFMLLRTLILKVSAIHLAPLWPIINAELGAALASALPDAEEPERYDVASLLQACKLLDILVTVAPDDFQLYEWLFVTDTIDAVYRPPDWTSAALVDEVAEGLGSLTAGVDETSALPTSQSSSGHISDGLRPPFLEAIISSLHVDVKSLKREELVRRVVKPFCGQLSILAFEATYSMNGPDLELCKRGLLNDLFDEGDQS